MKSGTVIKSAVAAVAAFCSTALSIMPARACTDFLITTTDGTRMIGRSMEWGLHLDSNVCMYPRGQSRSTTTPEGKNARTWQAKYGYVALDAHQMPLAIDGMNEKGLSVGMLWLSGSKYQTVSPEHPEEAMNLLDLDHWLLGNFTTVAEVKEAISKVKVWAPQMADWGGTPTAHLAVHDREGNSVVIEFTDGQQKIFDNPAGVLTNAPTFDWHTTNLKNYIHITASNAHVVQTQDTVLAPPGQGGGFLGIPGDWTPPSRFVRTSAMLAFAKKAPDARAGVNLAQHILNAVDIPLGDVREADNGLDHSDYTQWIVIKDMTNNVFYFRSYDNLTLRAIDMKKLDFSKGAAVQRLTPVAGGSPTVDVAL